MRGESTNGLDSRDKNMRELRKSDNIKLSEIFVAKWNKKNVARARYSQEKLIFHERYCSMLLCFVE